MNRAVAARKLAAELSAASPASSQIGVQDTTHRVRFRDIPFYLPDSNWQRVTPARHAPNTIQFEEADLPNPLVLSVDSIVADVSRTTDEFIRRVFEALRQYWQKQKQGKQGNSFVTWEGDCSPSFNGRAPDRLDQVVASYSIRPLEDVLYADDFSDPET